MSSKGVIHRSHRLKGAKMQQTQLLKELTRQVIGIVSDSFILYSTCKGQTSIFKLAAVVFERLDPTLHSS